MKTLAEIVKALRECEAAMAALGEKAKSETDTAKQAECRKAFEEKSKEFTALSAMFDEAKADQARAEIVKEAETFAQNVAKEAAKAASLNVNPPVDKAKESTIYDNTSRAKEAMVDHKAFFDFCAGEQLDANMLGHFGSKRADGNLYVKIPNHLREIIVGKSNDFHQSIDLTGGSTDTGAGFTIAPNFIAQYLQYGIDVPTIYDFCRSVPTVRGSAIFPMLDQSLGDEGGVTVTWPGGENEAVNDTQMRSTTYSLATNECVTIARMSNDLISRTSIDFEGQLIANIRRAMIKEWAKTILWGNGTTQPQGLLLAPGVHPVDRQSTGVVEYKDLVKLKFATRIAQRMNARFLVADSAMENLEEKTDNEGKPLYNENPSVGMRAGLIGYPVTPHEFKNATPATLASLGKKGDVVFGNWMDYGFGVEQDIMIARSTERYIELRETVYVVSARVAGKVIHPSSFAYLNE